MKFRFLFLLLFLFALFLLLGLTASATRSTLFLLSLLFLLTGGFGYLFLRPKPRSVEALAAVVEKLKAGDFSARAALPEEDPLSPLGVALNELAEELQKTLAGSTEQKRVQDTTLETLSEGVLAADAGGKIIFANSVLSSIFSLEAEPTGQAFHLVFRQPPLLSAFEKVLREGGSVELQVKEAFPTHRVVNVSFTTPEKARLVRVVAVFTDVTQSYRLEQVRKDFVANASHELRTPLAVVRGYVETLEDGLVPPEEKKQVFATLNQNIQRMGDLIDDLLHLSKLESPEFTLKPGRLKVLDVVTSVVSALKPQAEAKRQLLSVEVPAELSLTGDRMELEVALKNLLENAIHYTGEGGKIILTAGQKNGTTEITVADTGIGIPSQDLGRIFERFYRVDRSRSRVEHPEQSRGKEGGTGLGLSIVKHIAEAHGGRVEVESEVGKGTRFTLVLPG
ncbi:MAG: ATP-binding protein [candidate division Zixibacteria bacterium]|nr:ATP-binding protein [candidate division Zixibacteria bacterium]MCI0595720.1 ATP-binding protein [candidate division Zixibacteria bacterium]